MDISPFFIEFEYEGEWILAEVKPCCQEDDVFYYDISINNQFQYTITQGSAHDEKNSWKVALKNADKPNNPNLVQFIGEQIDQHYMA